VARQPLHTAAPLTGRPAASRAQAPRRRAVEGASERPLGLRRIHLATLTGGVEYVQTEAHKALVDQSYICTYCLADYAPAKPGLCLRPQTGSARRRPRTRVDGAREVLRQARVPRRRPHAAVERERRMLAGALRQHTRPGRGCKAVCKALPACLALSPACRARGNAESRQQRVRAAVYDMASRAKSNKTGP